MPSIISPVRLRKQSSPVGFCDGAPPDHGLPRLTHPNSQNRLNTHVKFSTMPTRHNSDHRSRHRTIPRFPGRIDAEMHAVSSSLQEKLSRRRQKKLRRLLILVIACCAGACMLIIIDSHLGHEALYPPELPYPESIHSHPSRDRGLTAVPARTPLFQFYLDSLRDHAPGRYLNILAIRPLQLDSLHRAENNLSLINP